MGNLISMYIANSSKKKTDYWGEVALSAGAFHKRVAFTIARERGNLLSDNIKIKKSNRQLLMTPLSVSFKATPKVMNIIKFQIYVLVQQKKTTRGP